MSRTLVPIYYWNKIPPLHVQGQVDAVKAISIGPEVKVGVLRGGGCTCEWEMRLFLSPFIETGMNFNQHIMPVVNCFRRPLLK